jgi:hypothetical protein
MKIKRGRGDISLLIFYNIFLSISSNLNIICNNKEHQSYKFI